MPELAEVEVVRRNLERWWTRPADRVEFLDQKLISGADPDALFASMTSRPANILRRGKYLAVRFADEAVVVFHFRMTGKIVREVDFDFAGSRLAWRIGSDDWLVFKDKRRLGTLDYLPEGDLESYEPYVKMGPEPYGLNGRELGEILPSRRRLKDALLDQAVIAGVGNIAISELFWQLGFEPEISVADLDEDDLDQLASAMPEYFDWLIADQMSDEIVYLGEGKAVSPFSIYGREGEGCPRCETSIERVKVAGRSTYYCPTCQA